MNQIILNLHIVSSIIPSLLTLLILYRSFVGFYFKRKIFKLDRQLPLFVVSFLYVQLLLGIILYVIHINDYSIIENIKQAEVMLNRRFWALEHFIMMFFALVFSHIAYVYSRNIKNESIFFKRSLIYFGLVFLLIFLSLAINGMRYSAV